MLRDDFPVVAWINQFISHASQCSLWVFNVDDTNVYISSLSPSWTTLFLRYHIPSIATKTNIWKWCSSWWGMSNCLKGSKMHWIQWFMLKFSKAKMFMGQVEFLQRILVKVHVRNRRDVFSSLELHIGHCISSWFIGMKLQRRDWVGMILRRIFQHKNLSLS